MLRNTTSLRRNQDDFARTKSPTYAVGNVVSSFLSLPGLIGFWPMSSINRSADVQDLSGNAHHLTYNGNPTINYRGIVPYMDFDGTGDYLSRADETDFDITGTETHIASALRGLTMGGWFYFDTLGASTIGIMSKFAYTSPNTDQRSYQIVYHGSGYFFFSISSDGTQTNESNIISTVAEQTGQWYFIVGRFTPSTEVAIFVNTTKNKNTTSIVASIYNSTRPFAIGGNDNFATLMDGRASMCFLCTAALSDGIIRGLYHQSRSLFGV